MGGGAKQRSNLVLFDNNANQYTQRILTWSWQCVVVVMHHGSAKIVSTCTAKLEVWATHPSPIVPRVDVATDL